MIPFISALTVIAGSLTAPNQVVVFPDRAQVTRLASVTCGARVPLVFDNIPPGAASDSFRARITDGTVDGLRAELVTHEQEYSARVETLEKQLEALKDEQRVVADTQNRLQQQQGLGRKYGEITSAVVSREMAEERPDVRAWQTAFDTTLNNAVAAAKGLADNQQKAKDLARKEGELKRQLDAFGVKAMRKSYSVEVLVSCGASAAAGSSAEVALTYLVGGASWSPSYEARADDVGSVELSTYATLSQVTQEDWSNVDLVLSTALPAENATPPDLKKLLVYAQQRAPEPKVLVRRDEYFKTDRAADNGDADGSGLSVKNEGLSVQLLVPEKTKVPGDGVTTRVFVGKTKLKAKFELRVVPKLAPVAFRAAELSNQGAWPLLPGSVEVFRPNGLVGRYELERVAQGAAFTLTFGADESVRVKRVVVEELKRDTGVFGGKKRFTYAYRFELANYGKAAVTLAVSDHVPVSELDDISVAISEKTTAGYTFGAAEGIARWQVPLKSQEKKNIDLAFRVDVPASYDMGGL